MSYLKLNDLNIVRFFQNFKIFDVIERKAISTIEKFLHTYYIRINRKITKINFWTRSSAGQSGGVLTHLMRATIPLRNISNL